MASNLFNYESQRLSAEELRQMQRFNSYNYAGVVGKSVTFEVINNDVTLKASEEEPVLLMGGGLIMTQTSDLRFNLSSDKTLAYLEVTLDSETGTIITDEYTGIVAKKTPCTYIAFKQPYVVFSVVDIASGNPYQNRYYEFDDEGNTYTLTSDTTVDNEKTYYTRYASSNFVFKADEFGTATYTYNGNTIWIDENKFIIPLMIRKGSEFRQVVTIRDLKDLSGFLSLEAYAKLKAYCEGTFVWSEAGEDLVEAPDGTTHRKGDIGGLNVTGITLRNNTNTGTEESPKYEEPVVIPNINVPGLIDKDKANTTHRLYIDADGTVKRESNYRTPVELGGTYVEGHWDENNVKKSAKYNIGIAYGRNNPTVSDPFRPAREGDIYLKIIE